MLDFITGFIKTLFSLPSEMFLGKENIVSFLCIIFVLFLLNESIKKSKISYSGFKGEIAVSRLLKQIAKNRFIVMNDVLLPLYDNMTQIDHIVIGSFGVICIETKNHSGKITGGMENVYWNQKIGFKTHSFYNPLAQNNTHVHAVQYFLHKEKLFNVPIYNLVVFSSNNVSIELNENNLPVIPVHCLEKYFKNKIFDKSKIDVNKVVNAIQKYRITDKKAKKQHIEHLKKVYSH